jgi:hypothetical protein
MALFVPTADKVHSKHHILTRTALDAQQNLGICCKSIVDLLHIDNMFWDECLAL